MTLEVERLLADAVAAAGSSDFGEPSFRDGLEVLVASLNGEAQLNPIGQAAAEASIVTDLTIRLQATEYQSAHPELALAEVPAPLFIVGVSRSGTTALSHLLSVDPANRSLLGWEISQPVPPPTAATYGTDPRFVAAMAGADHGPLDDLNPGFRAMHHDPPNMPLECVTVMAQDFVSLRFNATFNVETYGRWLLERDHVPTYRYHRHMLQLLQSEAPGRWQLKTPHHGLAVDAIAEVYPDARFIWTHRDPATCVASTASITNSLSGTFSDGDWAHYEGRVWTEMLGEMIERTRAARRRLGDDRFVDVDYRELVADPVATVEGLYRDLGESLSADAHTAMVAHTEEHRQHRYGRHEYDMADFGLDRGELDERFGDYRNEYDL